MNNYFTCCIIDDEQDAIDLLAFIINKLYKNIQIAGTYKSWEEAFEALQINNFDLIFLDISMPDKTGIDLLKLLPQIDSEIIFTTAYSEYAIEAFAFSTSGYLLKPVEDEKLIAAVNKTIERIKYKNQSIKNIELKTLSNSKLGIYNNKGIDYINIDSIIYLEAFKNYTKIVTETTTLMSSDNIGTFKHLIEKRLFFQVHRSFIINPNHVIRYESSGTVIMSNKVEIPVSSGAKDSFSKNISPQIKH